VTERFRVNVHGHLHAGEVKLSAIDMDTNSTKQYIDPRYLCVSVENTDYRPLSFDEVEARIKARWEATGYTNPVRAWGNGSGPN
jgi:calcineurin-like phosphoesterase family protein